MKLIYLHGLGQKADSWNQVIKALPEYEHQAMTLFPNGGLPVSFEGMRQLVLTEHHQQNEPFILVGLSLGAMVALSLVGADLPHLKGIVSAAGQYKLKGNKAYHLQRFLFQCFPKIFFAKQGLDKSHLIQFYNGLENFDMTKELIAFEKPLLAICGEKDRVNWKTSQTIAELAPMGQFVGVPNGTHTLNSDCPEQFAQILTNFISQI